MAHRLENITLNGKRYINITYQARLLKEKIPDIDSDTVHTFQGQEKDVILMSVVVDNTKRNSGAYFVGNKPDFLNVAFTRAKKQLILAGNYGAGTDCFGNQREDNKTAGFVNKRYGVNSYAKNSGSISE